MDTIIFAGNSNLALAEQIASYLGESLGKAKVASFSDGETNVSIDHTVRGKQVFVIQSTCNPANQNLMELLIMLDAIKRSGPKSIVAVIPYYGYSRQDRRTGFSRVPITAALTADMIQLAGADAVITMDLHAQQIQGFFKCQIVNITAKFLIANHIKQEYAHLSKESLIMVSPDVGGVTRTREIAQHVKKGVDLAIIDKRRPKANVSEVMNVIGDVQGKTCILIDDIVDTAGTLCKAADALMDKGAVNVIAYSTHAVLSGHAVDNVLNSKLSKLVVTNTIPIDNQIQTKLAEKLEILDTGKIFADTIRRIRSCDSVSQLYIDQQ